MKYRNIMSMLVLSFIIVSLCISCAQPQMKSYDMLVGSNYQNMQSRYREPINPQNIAMQIKQEKDIYSKEYLLDAVDVIGKCDKFLNTPKYEMFSVSSEINTAFKKLKINHAQYANSVLNKYLSEVITKISTICDNANYVDAQNSRPGSQKDYAGAIHKLDEIGILLEEIKPLISGINSGL